MGRKRVLRKLGRRLRKCGEPSFVYLLDPELKVYPTLPIAFSEFDNLWPLAYEPLEVHYKATGRASATRSDIYIGPGEGPIEGRGRHERGHSAWLTIGWLAKEYGFERLYERGRKALAKSFRLYEAQPGTYDAIFTERVAEGMADLGGGGTIWNPRVGALRALQKGLIG